MKRTAILVDHKTGRKFKIIIDPEPLCRDCDDKEKELQERVFGPKLSEVFDRERKILRIKCATCGKELGIYQALIED
jgi:hypothetical protein